MTTTNTQRTLAQRLSEGRISVPEALHFAMSLADALRKLHDAGKAHGAVTPSSIALTATGLDLIPSLGPPATVTPYTAPEVLQGQPADARSDIFSFGTLVFEMLTGRRAFDGDGQTALTLALCNAAPPPSGSPAVDRLVAGCVAKAPAARWQRMQKIIMELKLLTVAARRADAAPATRGVSDTALRSEIQQLEARLNARMQSHESSVSQLHQAASGAVSALKDQLGSLSSQLTAQQERPAQAPVDVDGLLQQIHSRIEETVGAVTRQLTALVDEKVGAAHQQVKAHVEEQVAGVREQASAQLEENVASVAQKLAAATEEKLQASQQQLTAQLEEKLAAVTHGVSVQLEEKLAAATQGMGAQVEEKLAAAAQGMGAQVEEKLAAATQQATAQVEEKLTAATRQAASQVEETASAMTQRVAAAEANMEEIRKHFATLQSNVASDLHDFELNLKSQAVAIESARTAMAQTDDLVERVVEALELLQSSVLDQHEPSVN